MAGKREGVGTRYAIELIGPTLRFVSANFFYLFLKFLKKGFLALILGVATGLLFIFLTSFIFPLLGIPVESMDLIWSDRLAFVRLLTGRPLVLAIALLLVSTAMGLTSWSYQAISSTSFIFVKGRFEGADPDLWAIIRRIKYQLLPYQIFNIGFLVMFLFIFPLLANAVFGAEAIIFLESAEYGIFSFVLISLVLFLTQFWLWELLVAEKGIFESLAASLSIIRKKFLSVVLFDIISIAILSLVFAPYFFFVFFIDLSFSFAEIRYTIIASLSVVAVLLTIEIAAMEAIFFPYAYSFWKAARPE